MLTQTTRFRQRSIHPPKTPNGVPKDGEKVTSGSRLGTMKTYAVDGSLLDTAAVNATGSLPSSIFVERMWDEVHPGPPFKDGGNMASVAIRAPFSGKFGSGVYSSYGNPNYTGKAGRVYTGLFCSGGNYPVGLPYEDVINMGPGLPWSDANFPSLSSYSLKAWDLITPQIEKAGGGQFLGELSDLPRMLKTSALGFRNLWLNAKTYDGRAGGKLYMYPKKAADHFINHHFGWVPFINDLIKFYDVYENSERYVKEAIQNNGRWVKRMRQVEATSTGETFPNQYGMIMPIFDNDMYNLATGSAGHHTVTQTVERRVWAMGKFKIYRPEFDPVLLAKFPSSWSHTRQLLLLYGVRINPDVIWRITPWSWLVDWMFSVGRNIKLLTQALDDSVAAQYAYLMCSEQKKLIETSVQNFWSGTATFSRIYTIDTKVREEMLSPYGFTFSWDQLSAKQIAILSALGIMRKR